MINNFHKSEKGSASSKFLIVAVVLFLAGNGLLNYIPAAYNGENLKSDVKAAVMQAVQVPPTTGTQVDVTKKRIINAVKANDAPADAFIEVKSVNNALQARVAYTKQVSILPFGLYTYKYQFDYSTNVNGLAVTN